MGTVALLVLAGCGETGRSGNGAIDVAPSTKYYSDIQLPTHRPEGLTYIKVQQLSHAKQVGQQVQLVFARDTIYVCSRPKEPSSLPKQECPSSRKTAVQRIKTKGDGVTVYAVDNSKTGENSKGGSVGARLRAIKNMRLTDTTTTPKWFATMLRSQERRG